MTPPMLTLEMAMATVNSALERLYPVSGVRLRVRATDETLHALATLCAAKGLKCTVVPGVGITLDEPQAEEDVELWNEDGCA